MVFCFVFRLVISVSGLSFFWVSRIQGHSQKEQQNGFYILRILTVPLPVWKQSALQSTNTFQALFHQAPSRLSPCWIGICFRSNSKDKPWSPTSSAFLIVLLFPLRFLCKSCWPLVLIYWYDYHQLSGQWYCIRADWWSAEDYNLPFTSQSPSCKYKCCNWHN